MEEWRSLEHHVASRRGAAERGAMGNGSMAGLTRNEQAVLAMDTQALQDALAFCDRELAKGKTANKVPQKLLEPAFQSMDVDRIGTVSLGEFRVALKRCGVSSSQGAVDQILQQIDGDSNGVLDLEEFSGFFDEIQEMLRYDADLRVSNILSDIFCRLCLLFNIGGLCVLTIFAVQGETSEIISMAFPILVIFTTVLCGYVIGIPLLQVMLGRQPAIWKQHFYRTCSNTWLYLLEGPFGRIFRRLSKCSRRCCRRGSQEPDDQVAGSETEGPKKTRIIAWADGDQTSSPRSPSQSSHSAQRDTLGISMEEATEISDLEAQVSSVPDSPASSRNGSRRVLSKRSGRSTASPSSRQTSRASSKARASKESASKTSWMSTTASSRETTSPRKSRRRAVIRKTRVTQIGGPPQGSNWLPSFLRSNRNKSQRSRSTFRQGAKRSSVDAAYEPGNFAQAAERAAFARQQPVGSFSPMQVRDLRLPPPAEPQVFIL